MNNKGNQWCTIAECMSSSMEKRHFHRSSKEHNKWLQWITACNRMDLEQKGPNYAYNNCTLCQLHFENKWFIRKTTLRLDPEALPTLFLVLISKNTYRKNDRVGSDRTDGNRNRRTYCYSYILRLYTIDFLYYSFWIIFMSTAAMYLKQN